MITDLQLRDPQATAISVFTARPETRTRMRDFFSSHIRNPNTRRAYREAVRQFSTFCDEHAIVDLAQVEPVHVAAFVELQLKNSIKAHGKAPARSAANAVRLDGGWSGNSYQSCARRSRAEAHPAQRKDASAPG